MSTRTAATLRWLGPWNMNDFRSRPRDQPTQTRPLDLTISYLVDLHLFKSFPSINPKQLTNKPAAGPLSLTHASDPFVSSASRHVVGHPGREEDRADVNQRLEGNGRRVGSWRRVQRVWPATRRRRDQRNAVQVSNWKAAFCGELFHKLGNRFWLRGACTGKIVASKRLPISPNVAVNCRLSLFG